MANGLRHASSPVQLSVRSFTYILFDGSPPPMKRFYRRPKHSLQQPRINQTNYVCLTPNIFNFQTQLHQQSVHRLGLTASRNRIGRIGSHWHSRSFVQGRIQTLAWKNFPHEDPKSKGFHKSRKLRKFAGKDRRHACQGKTPVWLLFNTSFTLKDQKSFFFFFFF